MTRSSDDLPAGITRHYNAAGTWIGYRVFQWVKWPGYPEGRILSKVFRDTSITLTALQAWQEDQRVDARRQMHGRASAPTIAVGFLAKADDYLDAVQAMPQFEQRKYHIGLWADLFGERDPQMIASHEIRAQRDAWLMHGPKWVYVKGQRVLKPFPLSPQEVNLRLRALENFWTVMYPNQANPVREVPECDNAAAPQPRGQSFELAYEILSHMPDVTAPKKGELAEEGSLSRIRFEVMFLTGLEHKQIGRLKESDVDDRLEAIRLPPRLKGKSPSRRTRSARPARSVPLIPAAVPVLQKFFAMGANKAFSRSSFWRTVKRAVKAANEARTARGLPLLDETLRPKDWTRHTFGTEAARRSKNPRVVQEMLGHSTIAQGAIYTEAAMQEHLIAAVAELDRFARPADPAPTSEPNPAPYTCKVSPPLKPTFDQSVRLVKRRNAQ